MSISEHEMNEWDRQTSILKSNGYTTEEINNRSFYDRHNMIRNNCDGCATGDVYGNREDF